MGVGWKSQTEEGKREKGKDRGKSGTKKTTKKKGTTTDKNKKKG